MRGDDILIAAFAIFMFFAGIYFRIKSKKLDEKYKV